MYIEKKVIVEEILYEDEEIQLLRTSSVAKKAIVYLAMTTRVKVNDQVIVNATSTTLRLGTGGVDIVTTVLNATPVEKNEPSGHIMKARYLPNQHSVLAVESQESSYHHHFCKTFSLNGKKVLVGELHSMIPICFWAMDFLNKDFNMAVIISDEASLPLCFSEHVRALKKDQRFCTITIGQGFGGTYEAINLPTALQFASEVLKSDVIFVTLGPGVVGTGTKYGFSGMALANWSNTISSLSGIPVWIPRLSEKDKRERHIGISHHTLTPLQNFVYAKCILPLPDLQGSLGEKMKHQIAEIQIQHDIHFIGLEPLHEIVTHCIQKHPLSIKTMGRNYEDDQSFFFGVAAAMKWLLQ